ncbi:hypothetical protein QUB75_19680 [Microcoleus sp. K1-B6]|uniref:hypothetical protein n=1 Tax=Microcoleus sp. K1-B6 TaxID=2818787 RepID=UPI002FD8600F
MEGQSVQEGMLNSLSLVTTIGSDLSDSEREEIIKKAYISSLAVKDFVAGELDVDSFLDIQKYCLTESSIDNYLDTVEANIENLSFAELLMS